MNEWPYINTRAGRFSFLDSSHNQGLTWGAIGWRPKSTPVA